VLFKLAEMNTQCSRQLYSRFAPIMLISGINKKDWLTPVYPFLDFINGYPSYFCQINLLQFSTDIEGPGSIRQLLSPLPLSKSLNFSTQGISELATR
jgi:hypothetical protein